jgi:hypothetical protein
LRRAHFHTVGDPGNSLRKKLGNDGLAAKIKRAFIRLIRLKNHSYHQTFCGFVLLASFIIDILDLSVKRYTESTGI